MTTVLEDTQPNVEEVVNEVIENLERLSKQLSGVYNFKKLKETRKLQEALSPFMPPKHIKLIIEELKVTFPDMEISAQQVQNIWSCITKDSLNVFAIAIKLAIPGIRQKLAMFKDLEVVKQALSSI